MDGMRLGNSAKSLASVGAALMVAAAAACSAPAPVPATTPASPSSAPSVAPSAAPSLAPIGSPTTLAAVPSPSTQPLQEDTLQGIIDGARREGEIDLSWSADTAGGDQGAQDWVDGLNQMYGLNLKLQFTEGLSMPDMATKITQEYQAHQNASSDVEIGSEAHIFLQMQSGTLIPEDWAAWSPSITDPRLLAPDGVGVEIASRPVGITYNSDVWSGDAIPHSMADLLKPEYTGKLASTTYGANFDSLSSPELWGQQRTIDYVTQFSKQISGLVRCGEDQRILDGEFAGMALDCGTYDALAWQRKGAPMAQSLPSDVGLVVYWYMGVPRNSAHPNASKLLINYIMTRQGQDVLWNDDAADHHLIPGSHTAQLMEQLGGQGAQFKSVDVQFVIRNNNAQTDAIRQRIQNILQGRGS